MASPQQTRSQTPAWQKEGYPHIWMPYCQMQTSPLPAPVVKTRNVRMELADGREIIDGLASWWSACHGYNHPHIRAAVEQQLATMPHVMFGGINHPQALRLAKRLAELAPGDMQRVFFCDSGSVSVEVAMKMAVQYWLNANIRGKHRFVSFYHAYHGDTIAAMSVCDPVNGMHSHFAGFLPEQFCRPLPANREQLAELRQFVASEQQQIAGVIVEPIVQGAGGMRFHAPEVLAEIRAICDENDLLLIADEIATGFGRTGAMFACEHADVVPDIMCVSKALTGGTMAFAATLAREHVFERFLSDEIHHALMHGPTFMANPLACAAANASLDLFESEPRLEQAQAMESDLLDGLTPCRSLPQMVDVRSKGAVGVIQVEELRHLDQLRQMFLEEEVWVRPFGDAIYITPSLNIESEDLTRLCDAIVKVVHNWSQL